MLLFQDLHRTLTRRRIRIESELKSALSDDFIARITGQCNEAVVDFEKDGVLNPADDQAIRTRLERLYKSLLALAQRRLGQLPFGDVNEGDDGQDHASFRIVDRRGADREVGFGGILEPVLDLFVLDDFSGYQRAGGWVLLGLLGEAGFTHRAERRVRPIVFGGQERTLKHSRCFDVVKNQPARWRFGNDHSDRHLFENLLQTIAFAFDLFRPALAFVLHLFPSSQVVEHELSELLSPIETDRADLDGYCSSIPAAQCALHLSRRRPFGRNGSYECAAMIP